MRVGQRETDPLALFAPPRRHRNFRPSSSLRALEGIAYSKDIDWPHSAMFKISTPRPAPTPAYLLAAEQNARAEEGDMDLDTNETDPSMTSNAEARVAIPGETIANAQEWMRCAAEQAGAARAGSPHREAVGL